MVGVTALRKVLDLLTPRERRQLWTLAPLVVLMAFAEVVGIAAVAPFLELTVNPGAAQSNVVLAFLYDLFGFDSRRWFLIAIGFAVVFILFAANAFLAFGNWILFRFGAIRNHTIGRRLLIRYLQQPYAFFLTRNTAALANNVLQEVQQIVVGVVMPSLQLVARGVTVLAIVVLLLVTNPLLAGMVTVLLGGAYLIMYRGIRGYVTRIGEDRVRANQERYRSAQEAMSGIKDLRLLGREKEMVERFSVPSGRFANYQANSQILGALPRYVLEAIAFGSVVFIVLLLLATGLDPNEVVPVLGLYAFAGYRLLPALQAVFGALTSIRYSMGALDEVHEMVAKVDATRADVDDFVDREALEPLPYQDRLVAEDVSFHYANGEPVLRDVTLHIPARASVAFVGTTGAGKTTMVDVLLGLLEPSGGTIHVDGVKLDGATIPRWMNNVGYVAQAIYLTDDTVARNIAFGLPDEAIDMEAVKRAARMAQVASFIEEELPDGYDTVVGERGVRLSGGQRQRIGIARALYHDPEVLVFDEATSALDGATERAVYESIRALAGKKTLITIAHRLSTVEDADTIFVLDRGRLVAQGRYDEVYRDSETFRRMAERVVG